MKIKALLPILGMAIVTVCGAQTAADSLPTPGFHHLHINSTDPDAAIDWYTKAFKTAVRTTFDGKPAIKTGDIYLLFNKVSKPPTLSNPQTAIWHWGWNVPDERGYMDRYRAEHFTILPLWTGDDDNYVQISADFYPGANGTLGRTKEEVAEAKAEGLKPVGGNTGFGYLGGPDTAMIEVAATPGRPERFNHVHMFQDEPLCAQLWYQKHLNVKPRPARGGGAPVTEATCKVPHGPLTFVSLDKGGMYRSPSAGVAFGGISMMWYIRTVDYPLTSTLGHTGDHIALSVNDLDAWYAKEKSEGVKILKAPYKLADTRAFMIEGPSKEALELVEVK